MESIFQTDTKSITLFNEAVDKNSKANNLKDLKKAVEWGREQQKKILNDKGERLAEALMEKMTPLILLRNTPK